MRRGRPLRFLGTTLGLWVSVRLMILWPQIDDLATLRDALIPPVAALAIAPGDRRTAARMAPLPPRPRTRPAAPLPIPAATDRWQATTAAAPTPIPLAPRPLAPLPSLGVQLPPPLAIAPRRLAASGWLILRSAGPPADAQRLGGAQAGMRLTYALGRARRVALSLRLSAPLHGRGAEIGPGIDWQPVAAPIHLIVEQRIAVDGGRGGPAALLVAGLDPTPVGEGFRIEAYGQAGVISRGRVAGFADGAARVARPIATPGGHELDLGVGAWGAIQPGAARLDIGPSIAIAIPAGRHRLRLALDWRQRIAGRAAPASGPVLSIGSDF